MLAGSKLRCGRRANGNGAAGTILLDSFSGWARAIRTVRCTNVSRRAGVAEAAGVTVAG